MTRDNLALVLIHGRAGVHRDTSEVWELEQWLQVLRPVLGDELINVRVEMAYYRDELYRGELPWLSGGTESATLTAEAAATATVIDQIATEILAIVASDPVLTKLASVKIVPAAPEAASMQADHLPDRGAFLKDAIKYFALGYRERINPRLETKLQALAGMRTMLIAHSLGTVVSYDVLTTQAFQVDTLITMGSPLGWLVDFQNRLPMLIRRLPGSFWEYVAEEAQRLERQGLDIADALKRLFGSAEAIETDRSLRPPTVYTLMEKHFPTRSLKRWQNAYDRRDPISVLDPTLREEFLANGAPKLVDVEVDNPPGRPHGRAGYLTHPTTIAAIREFIGSAG